MKIFVYDNYKLTLNTPEILLVPEFKKIWDLDKSEDKSKAFEVFTYAYLMEDFRSPFRNYTDEERHQEAKNASGLRQRKIEAKTTERLLSRYRELMEQNKILSMISSMYKSLDKLKVYFETINFEEKVESGARKGTHLYSPTELIKVIKEAKFLMETIKHLEEQAREELAEDTVTKGGHEIGWIMEQ